MVCNRSNHGCKRKDSPFIKYDRLNKINNLPLERVSHPVVKESIDYISPSVDIGKILDNSFGPSIEDWQNPEKIDLVIKTKPYLQKHFETMPLKFNAKQTNKDCEFTYKDTIVSKELISYLMQFGAGIEIISPKKLDKNLLIN